MPHIPGHAPESRFDEPRGRFISPSEILPKDGQAIVDARFQAMADVINDLLERRRDEGEATGEVFDLGGGFSLGGLIEFAKALRSPELAPRLSRRTLGKTYTAENMKSLFNEVVTRAFTRLDANGILLTEDMRDEIGSHILNNLLENEARSLGGSPVFTQEFTRLPAAVLGLVDDEIIQKENRISRFPEAATLGQQVNLELRALRDNNEITEEEFDALINPKQEFFRTTEPGGVGVDISVTTRALEIQEQVLGNIDDVIQSIGVGAETTSLKSELDKAVTGITEEERRAGSNPLAFQTEPVDERTAFREEAERNRLSFNDKGDLTTDTVLQGEVEDVFGNPSLDFAQGSDERNANTQAVRLTTSMLKRHRQKIVDENPGISRDELGRQMQEALDFIQSSGLHQQNVDTSLQAIQDEAQRKQDVQPFTLSQAGTAISELLAGADVGVDEITSDRFAAITRQAFNAGGVTQEVQADILGGLDGFIREKQTEEAEAGQQVAGRTIQAQRAPFEQTNQQFRALSPDQQAQFIANSIAGQQFQDTSGRQRFAGVTDADINAATRNEEARIAKLAQVEISERLRREPFADIDTIIAEVTQQVPSQFRRSVRDPNFAGAATSRRSPFGDLTGGQAISRFLNIRDREELLDQPRFPGVSGIDVEAERARIAGEDPRETSRFAGDVERKAIGEFPNFSNTRFASRGPLFGITGQTTTGQQVQFGGGPLIREGTQFRPAMEADLQVDPLDIDPLDVTERIAELAGGDAALFNAFAREVPRFQTEFQQEEAERFAGVSRTAREENREIITQDRGQRFRSIQRDIKKRFQPRSLEDFITDRSERFKEVFALTPAGQPRRRRRGITRFTRPV